MRLLILGGTRFLGRHIVDAALARAHDVTVFTRGRLPLPAEWNGKVAQRTGDRDPRNVPGLAALDDASWDAVIDTCGYVPRVVGASARLLAPRAAHYTFVSSLSAYADESTPGYDENAPLAALADPASESIEKDYGALKAASEAQVVAAFGARACIVRPGLIVGPYDPSDRFSYWAARFVQPKLLGDRPARAVLPLPPQRPLQFVDARDLAEWMVELSMQQASGAFNATSPDGHFTMGGLADALCELARVSGTGVEPAWIDESVLVAAGVTPWTGLPLWIPQDDVDARALMQADARKAQAAGLAIRPLAATLADTAAWLAARTNEGAWKNVLTADAERSLLEPDSTTPPAAGP